MMGTIICIDLYDKMQISKTIKRRRIFIVKEKIKKKGKKETNTEEFKEKREERKTRKTQENRGKMKQWGKNDNHANNQTKE